MTVVVFAGTTLEQRGPELHPGHPKASFDVLQVETLDPDKLHLLCDPGWFFRREIAMKILMILRIGAGARATTYVTALAHPLNQGHDALPAPPIMTTHPLPGRAPRGTHTS